jgi:hypothetical protein
MVKVGEQGSKYLVEVGFLAALDNNRSANRMNRIESKINLQIVGPSLGHGHNNMKGFPSSSPVPVYIEILNSCHIVTQDYQSDQESTEKMTVTMAGHGRKQGPQRGARSIHRLMP